jgi:PAS domain S-box-containing protein
VLRVGAADALLYANRPRLRLAVGLARWRRYRPGAALVSWPVGAIPGGARNQHSDRRDVLVLAVSQWARTSSSLYGRDITERKRADAALQRSEAIHRRLSDANLVGVGFGDTKGNITYVNDEMLRMIGYTRADYEARRINWAECVAPEFRGDQARWEEQLLRDGQISGWERAFQRPDGDAHRI